MSLGTLPAEAEGRYGPREANQFPTFLLDAELGHLSAPLALQDITKLVSYSFGEDTGVQFSSLAESFLILLKPGAATRGHAMIHLGSAHRAEPRQVAVTAGKFLQWTGATSWEYPQLKGQQPLPWLVCISRPSPEAWP